MDKTLRNKNLRPANAKMQNYWKSWGMAKQTSGTARPYVLGFFTQAVLEPHWIPQCVNVNDLREFRNEAHAHVSKGTINDTDYKRLIGRVEAAFLGLNLDVTDIRAISHQQSFPTEELRLLVDQLLKEQEKSSALEEELHAEPKTFLGNLPA